MISRSTLATAAFALLALVHFAPAATLEVGAGMAFSRIENAYAQAQPGDEIEVYPLPGGVPYERTAVFATKPRIAIRGVPTDRQPRVKISGKGFNYSGAGSVPRAIFQFNRGADDCLVENFELCDATNDSHNGAGVRINQANRVTVRNCAIHDNNMGIMSNGDGTRAAALDQRIEHCDIHHNGDRRDPGYSHNLYLGGASVTLRFCEVHHSLVGHNVKSRAHHTRLEYCYIHHSAERECDLVDAAETALPESHAVLVGNTIVKDPECPGNRAVLHFGQDGGKGHDGAMFLAFNTVVTPFIGPLVDLSAPKARAVLVGNLVSDGGRQQRNQTVAAARNGAQLSAVTGRYNWFGGDFAASAKATGLAEKNVFRRLEGEVFRDPAAHDYRLAAAFVKQAFAPAAAKDLELPPTPGMSAKDALAPLAWQYRHPLGKERRPAGKSLTLGAYQ